MKTNIKARITCLFISKTTIMVNKCEKIYFIYNFSILQTTILFLYFFYFIPFLLFFYSFSFTFFVLILSYMSGTSIPFCRHIWLNFLSSFCTCTLCTPLCTRLEPCLILQYTRSLGNTHVREQYIRMKKLIEPNSIKNKYHIYSLCQH